MERRQEKVERKAKLAITPALYRLCDPLRIFAASREAIRLPLK